MAPARKLLAQVEDQNTAAGPHRRPDRFEPAVRFRQSFRTRHRSLEIDFAHTGNHPPLHRRVRWQREVSHTSLASHIVHPRIGQPSLDRKSTRLNSSHLVLSYAVFCLKKKNKTISCMHVTELMATTIRKTTRVQSH